MGKPLVIEFAGLPGSGKTTLSREVAHDLRLDGHSVHTSIEAARIRAAESGVGTVVASVLGDSRATRAALWWLFYAASTARALLFAWANRRQLVQMASHQSRRPIPRRLKAHIAWWYLQLGGRRDYLASSDVIDAVVFDDGFVHRSLALFSSPSESADAESVAAYIRSVPRPSLLVTVRADRQLCFERVVRRGPWSHSPEMTSEQLSAYLQNGEKALEIATASTEDLGIPSVLVDNSGSLGGAVAQVDNELRRVLSASPNTKRET